MFYGCLRFYCILIVYAKFFMFTLFLLYLVRNDNNKDDQSINHFLHLPIDMFGYFCDICCGFLVRPHLFALIPLSDQVWLADSVTTSKQVIYWLMLHMGSYIKH